MTPIVAQVADLGTFLVLLIVAGPQAEANPITRSAITSGLFVEIVVAKVLVLVVLASWRLRYRYAVRLAATVVGTVGFTSNLLALRP